MDTTSEILRGPTLVLDAGGSRIYGGLLAHNQWVHWESSEEQALESLYSLTRSCLRESRQTLADLKAFAFCDGPGSTLGLRLASAAILTWQQLSGESLPVYHYHSLQLTCFPLRPSGNPADSWLITDYRKNDWLGTSLDRPDCIEQLDTERVTSLSGPVYYLPQRKSWIPPPRPTQTVAYPFETLPSFLASPNPGRLEERPLLALPGKSDYRKWTPERHRAPSGS